MGLAWGGFANGDIPLTQLTPVPNFRESGVSLISRGSNLMKSVAALQLSRMMHDFYVEFGVALSATEVYRPLINQDYYWDRYINKKPGWTLAARRGTSIHGWGLSVDLNVNGGNPSGAHLAWLRANAAKYGFVNDVASEVWHWSYREDLVKRTIVQSFLIENPNTRDDPALPVPTPSKQINLETDMPRLVRIEEPSHKEIHGLVTFLFTDHEVRTQTKTDIYRMGRAWGLIPPSDPDKVLTYAENIGLVEYQTAINDINNNQKRIVASVAAAVWSSVLPGWNGSQPASARLAGVDQKADSLSAATRDQLVKDIQVALPSSVGGGNVEIDATQIVKALEASLVPALLDAMSKRLQS